MKPLSSLFSGQPGASVDRCLGVARFFWVAELALASGLFWTCGPHLAGAQEGNPAAGVNSAASGNSAPPPQAAAIAESNAVDFTKDVLPVLSQHCFACHDGKKQIAGLRLDIQSGAYAGGESGAKAVVAGDLEASELIARVTSTDEATRMPPAEDYAALTEAEISILKDWILAGGTYPTDRLHDSKLGHWAFQPPVRPSVPKLEGDSWSRNALDQFVLAKLKEHQLSPSGEADRATWLRRVSLDLIGLPPTPGELNAFLQDTRADAREQAVERLLNSPHYGEKWGRMWLDAARYADSDGFEKDKQRFVWFYRDWVINAFNRDLPYDKFVIEQLAGDQLPGATQDQLVATGYLRNSMINEEGGIDPEQFRMEAMYDRMDAIGKGILGLTIQCAQCHTHKYDPLTHDEYYQMFAFLNNDYEANIVVYAPEEQRTRSEIFSQIAELEARAFERLPNWENRLAEWEEAVRYNQPTWTVLRPEFEADSTGGQKYRLLADGSFLAEGYAPTHHTAEGFVTVMDRAITAFKLELLNDGSLPRQGPGRSILGTAALTEFKVSAAPATKPDQFSDVKMASATADVNPPRTPLLPIFDDKSGKERVTGPIEYAIDDKEETAWGIDVGPGLRNQPRKAVFQCETSVLHDGGTVLKIGLSQDHGGWNSDDNQSHNLGRFRLSYTTAANATADPLPARVRQALSIPREDRTPSQMAAVKSYWRSTLPELAEVNRQIDALWQQHPEGTNQLVLQALDSNRTTSMLKRGNFLDPVKAVGPGVPAFLHPLPEHAPRTRLTFAKWLVDRKSPTTARSFVNRVWQAYFGMGLVETAEDLGVQSPAPSHPELLDYLAVEFMERGWGMKDLHRMIVLSATYGQSSKVTPELLKTDPYNRLLARGPRFRVEGESVRDIALAVSGLLNPTLGGPSVYPPIPDFLMQPPLSYGPKIWKEEKGANRYRRAIYTHRYRSVPFPMLQTFDAPNGDFACVRRVRSNTPLQALVTLNEPIFVECAKALGQRLQDVPGEESSKLVHAWELCMSRAPTESELAILKDLLVKHRQHFSEQPEAAKALSGLEQGGAERAAWISVARVLLNLDETISKE